MPHTQHDRSRLRTRVRRIQGQLGAVLDGLERNEDCSAILQTIAAARGALNGLMVEVISGHLREHVLPADAAIRDDQREAAEQVVRILGTYLR